MSRGERSVLFVVVGLVVGGAGYWIYEEFRKADKVAQQSCMSSIAGATDRAIKAGRIEPKEEARELTNEEVGSIIADGVGDCSGHEAVIEQVHIAIGNVNKVSKAKMRVWLNGADGISGTSDDLVIPWEENLNH